MEKINKTTTLLLVAIIVIGSFLYFRAGSEEIPDDTTETLTVPTSVQGLASKSGQASMTLNWEAPTSDGGSDVVYYQVSYTDTVTSETQTVIVGDVLTYTIEDLAENPYSFSVIAVNSVGESTIETVTATPLTKLVEELRIGHVSTAGNTFGWGDMGTYLYRATVYQESLIGMDADGNYVPRLAQSWETTDSVTWTFHLYENVTWHDGEPFTANDVLFTIDYTLEKQPWGMNDAKFMEQLVDYYAPDEYTIVLEMAEPYSNLLNNVRIGLVVIPEHIYSNVDDPMTYGLPEDELDATIGTGPYKVVSLDTTARLLTFTANEDYHLGVPSVQNIVIRYYSSADSMMLALLSGEIDTTFGWGKGVDYYNVPKILENPDLDIMLNPSAAVNALNINTEKAPFDSLEMRQALASALDYNQLCNLIIGGYGTTPNSGIVPTSVLYYVDTPALEQGLVKANTILDSMGYLDIDGDGYREYPNGTKFQPVILTRGWQTWVTRSAEIVEDNLQAIGIDVQIEISSTSAAWQEVRRARTYDMIFGGTSQAGTYAWEGYYTVQVDAYGSLGDCQVYDAEFQELIVDLRTATNEAEKEAAAAAVQMYYSENLRHCPLSGIR